VLTLDITVQDAMILHLNKYAGKLPDVYNMPFDTTQDGMAAALGISRAHACFELKKLANKGLVGFITAHTPGSSRKVMAYYLEPSGVSAVSGIYENMKRDNTVKEPLFVGRSAGEIVNSNT